MFMPLCSRARSRGAVCTPGQLVLLGSSDCMQHAQLSSGGRHCGWPGGLSCRQQDWHLGQSGVAALRLLAAGTKAHPNREAPRCLPCGFEDELLDSKGCPGHRGYIAAKVGATAGTARHAGRQALQHHLMQSTSS